MGQLVLKVLFIGICLLVTFGGHHPPSYAQSTRLTEQRQFVPVVTAEDAVQDTDIAAINDHLKNTDVNVKEQYQLIAQVQSDIAGMRGEERIIGAVLGIIASSSIILQWRKRPA